MPSSSGGGRASACASVFASDSVSGSRSQPEREDWASASAVEVGLGTPSSQRRSGDGPWGSQLLKLRGRYGAGRGSERGREGRSFERKGIRWWARGECGRGGKDERPVAVWGCIWCDAPVAEEGSRKGESAGDVWREL